MVGETIFFAFLAAVILVPQVLIYNDRRRLHETVRVAFERGQPVPPELIMALQPRGRRYRYDPYLYAGAAGWRQPAAATPPSPSAASAAETAAAATPPDAALAPPFLPPPPERHDLRRGLIWLGVGLGFIAAGVACYAGLYNVGGAQEALSMFSAFGSIPLFIGLTYLALWWFEGRRTRA